MYNNLIIGDLVKYVSNIYIMAVRTLTQTLSRIVVGKDVKDNSGSIE